MQDENDIIFSQQTIDIGVIFSALDEFFGTATSEWSFSAVLDFIQTLWGISVIILLLLAALFLFGYIYAAIRFNQLADIEMERIRTQEDLYQQLYGSHVSGNSRLKDIEMHINTNNPNDWKLAIIEADIMLGQILDKAGYTGSTIGDQLKSASHHAFKTLDDAWTAHRVRNQIAHEGADFVLTHKVAKETIIQYKRVFAEFNDLL